MPGASTKYAPHSAVSGFGSCLWTNLVLTSKKKSKQGFQRLKINRLVNCSRLSKTFPNPDERRRHLLVGRWKNATNVWFGWLIEGGVGGGVNFSVSHTVAPGWHYCTLLCCIEQNLVDVILLGTWLE